MFPPLEYTENANELLPEFGSFSYWRLEPKEADLDDDLISSIITTKSNKTPNGKKMQSPKA